MSIQHKKLVSSLAALVMLFGLRAAADDALILHLKFDEGGGLVAKDSSGRGHDAKLVNPQWEEFGLQGKAVRLNGEDAFVELPLHADFDNLKNFTFSIWFKAEKYEHGMSLFSRGGYENGWGMYVYRSFIALAGRQLKPAVLYTTFTAGTQPIQPFYNLTMTGEPAPDAPDKMAVRYYVNGKLRATAEGLSAFITGDFLPSPKIPVTIGKFLSSSSRWFDGIIDEVKCYRRTLTADEIAAEYKKTSAAVASGPIAAVPELKPRTFNPLKKPRLAIYEIPGEYGAIPVRPLEWFEEQARKNGLKPTRIDHRQLCNPDILNTVNYDTLLLPVNCIPLEGEDSIFKFLAQGGNLIASTIVPSVFNLEKDGTPARDKDGKIIYKQHSRGWFAPFLVRHLDRWDWAVRKVISPLAINPAVVDITGDCLPAVFPADPSIRYTPADTWNNVKNGDGSYGDGANYAQAADLKIDLYRERNGIGSDFIAYRYYNNLIFGATFVELGQVGCKLLKSEKGAGIFTAILHLLESKLPGEQPEQYYRDIVKLNADWSNFGFVYFDTLAALRDAAIYAYLTGADYETFNTSITAVTERFGALSSRRKNQELDLFNQKPAAGIAPAVKSLLTDVAAADADFKALQARAVQSVAAVRRPAPVKVKHKYGTIPSIASLTLPTNLNRMRGRLFQSMRDIGVNVYSGPFHGWYAADQKTRDNFGNIMRDHKFVYSAGARHITGGGIINPADGAITERDPIDYPYESIRKHIKDITDAWSWKGNGNFRIGTGDECGLGYQYWGAAAAEDFRNHLRKFYNNDITAMNAHCGSAYKDFAEVKLPVRQPASPAEHAVWEHWRRCREAKLESLYANFYRIVKECDPELDVFQLPSTGAKESPLYGVNFYNVTKHQDVSGIDGTCCNINMEWIYNDLTTKRYLTSEWGGLYQESSVTYVNGKLIEELAGGALGFEHHVWSFGGDAVSFVNPLDMPGIYGNMLRMTLRDARKIDHLILDGRRAAPEIGILFSQTARIHDQGWGWGGEKTFSDHLQSVANYYELFLDYYRSARVIPEEMLLENKMPPVAVLFVPQARFLAEEVQNKLLDYAKKGGIVITEGRVGEFDNYGHKSDGIFREIGIVPTFTESRELAIGGATIAVPEADRVFSPAGGGNALATLGSAPALVSADYGKGKFVIFGFNPGLHRYAAFPAIIETTLKELGLTPRFIVSDASVILREWQYDKYAPLFDKLFGKDSALRDKAPGKDTYLLLTSKADHWSLQELTVKVRGKVTIEDYLFGREVKTEYHNGYTSFKTLSVNGFRVFRIPGKLLSRGAPAGLTFADARRQPARFTLAGASGTRDNYEPIKLPYKGRLSDSAPLKYGDFVFSLTTLASGDNAKVGDMYLAVTRGKESQKKLIEVNKDYYFRMREKTFKIRSSDNFYMFPFYCDLVIEEVAVAPPGAAIDVEKKNGKIIFSNALIAFALNPGAGAAVTSIKPADEMTEQVYVSGQCWAATGGLPGPFLDQAFAMEEREKTDDLLTADFSMAAPSQGQRLTQTFGMRRDTAGFTLKLACANATQLDQTLDLRWHPELMIGHAADTADRFFVPTGGTVKDIPFRALNAGHGMPPSGNWAAIVDTRQKLAYVCAFKKEQVQRVYIWEGGDFYTLEIFAPKTTLKPGATINLDMGFYLLRGLGGVDAWQDGVAAWVDLAPIVNQTKPFAATIQVAAAFAGAENTALACELWQGNKKIKDLGNYKDTVAFELPIAFNLTNDLAVLDDGEYEFRLKVKCDQHEELAVAKPVRLAGKALNTLLQAYEKGRAEIALRKNLPAAELFSLRVMLEELRHAIAGGKIDDANKTLAEFTAACNQSIVKEKGDR